MIWCDVCRRGLVPSWNGEWADPCPICKGQQTLTIYRIAKLIDENPRNLWNLVDGRRQRPSTTFRICSKLCDLTERRLIP